MPSRDSSTATCWSSLILAGSVRLKTPPTPALASASVIWPSERSCTCCNFSFVVILEIRSLILVSMFSSAVGSGPRVASLCSATPETRNPTTITPSMRAIRLNFTPLLHHRKPASSAITLDPKFLKIRPLPPPLRSVKQLLHDVYSSATRQLFHLRVRGAALNCSAPITGLTACWNSGVTKSRSVRRPRERCRWRP